MVTLRRDVKTESERYGGYNTGFSATMTNYDRYRLSGEDQVEAVEYDSKYYDNSEEYKNYLWNELQRTSPRRILSPEEVKSGVVKEEAIDYVAQPTYTPSATATTVAKPIAKSINRDEQKAQGLTFMAKAICVVYAIVVVFFLALIAINANSLNVMRGKIAELEAAQVQVEADQTVTDSADDTLVFGTGNEATLVGAESAGAYSLMSVSAPVSYEVESNWFDNVCDWLSSVVGD